MLGGANLVFLGALICGSFLDMDSARATAAHRVASPPPMGSNRPAWTLQGPKFTPVRKGNIFSVVLNETFYDTRINSCSRFACIGRLMMPKGTNPMKFHDLKLALRDLWKLEDWHLLSLGHGLFVFHFDTEVTRNHILNSGVFKLPLGTLYMQPWTPGFNAAKAATSMAKVWIRLHGLGFEFMHRSIILSLAAAFGRPLTIDTGSLDRGFGSYVRVLVEMDLS